MYIFPMDNKSCQKTQNVSTLQQYVTSSHQIKGLGHDLSNLMFFDKRAVAKSINDNCEIVLFED